MLFEILCAKKLIRDFITVIIIRGQTKNFICISVHVLNLKIRICHHYPSSDIVENCLKFVPVLDDASVKLPPFGVITKHKYKFLYLTILYYRRNSTSYNKHITFICSLEKLTMNNIFGFKSGFKKCFDKHFMHFPRPWAYPLVVNTFIDNSALGNTKNPACRVVHVKRVTSSCHSYYSERAVL